jgi:hypothetical protein
MEKLFTNLYIIIAAIFITASADAQVTSGPKVGLNFSSLHVSSESEDLKGKPSLHLGWMFNIPVVNNLSIEPDFLFSQNTFKSDITGSVASVDIMLNNIVTNYHVNGTYRFYFVMISAPVKYKLKNGITFQTGPRVGMLVGVDYKEKESATVTSATAEPYSYVTEHENSSADGYNTFTDGFCIGAGYEYKKRAGINLRYDISLENLFRTGKSDFFLSGKINTLQVSLYMILAPKKKDRI